MSLTERVTHHLRTADLSRLRHQDIASACCMSYTSLRRKLRAEGTTFERLRDSERKRRVEQALAVNPCVTCHTLTEICGFSEYQTLIRAFRDWFGMPLSEYKVKLMVAA